MLHEYSVSDANDVCRDPVARREPMSREAPMDDYIFVVGEDHAGFVSQGWRRAFDQIEETFTSWRDVSTVLDVVGRPKSLGRFVVALIEKRIECFQYKSFILLRI